MNVRRVLKYLSVCSGIEAATVAWSVFGWQAVAFSEIEPFPCAVLAHHYPHVPNLGNLLGYLDWPEELLAEVDILAGGTPCQAFSVAGLRESLADERGNLTLVYVQLVHHINAIRARYGRPAVICVWENVPGVLSTRDNAFGCFLAALAAESVPLQPPGGKWTDAGYVRGPEGAAAWRLIDAQYFGLAQRRERVFLVGSAIPGFHPEEVLFDAEGVRRDSPPRRAPRKDVAPTLSARTKGGGGLGTDFDLDGGLIPEIVPTLDANYGRLHGASGQDLNHGHGHLLVEVCFDTTQITSAANGSNPQPGDPCHPLTAGAHPPELVYSIQAGATRENPESGPDGIGIQEDIAYTLEARSEVQAVASSWVVRRLIPVECERLQGFEDDYTRIPWRGKPADQCPDGHRYKACGNSWATHCARWLGGRIEQHLLSLAA